MEKIVMEMLGLVITVIALLRAIFALVKSIIIGINKVNLEICAMIILDLIVMGIM
jgi:hypothetical protein